MIRLIDLDKLLEQIKIRRYSKASLSLLYNQEVIEAIPIKWLQDNFNCNDEYTLKVIINEWLRYNKYRGDDNG